MPTMHSSVIDAALDDLRTANRFSALLAAHERELAGLQQEYVSACREGTDSSLMADQRSFMRNLMMDMSEHGRLVAAYRAKVRDKVKSRLHYIDFFALTRHYRLGEDRFDILYKRAGLKRQGQQFAEHLMSEDVADFCDWLNSVAGYHHSTAKMRRKFAQKWEEHGHESVLRCEQCGDFHSHSDEWNTVEDGEGSEHQWCEDCTESSAYYSDEMQRYIVDDDREAFYNSTSSFENSEPDSYVTRYHANNDSDLTRIVHPHTGSRCWVDDDVLEYFRDEYEEPEIASYHHGHRVGLIRPTEYGKRAYPIYVGLEVELEFDDNADRRRAIRSIRSAGFERNYLTMEKDSSLNCGFECVTGYSGLDVHHKKIPQLLAAVDDAIDKHENAGLHVHVSKGDMTPWHMAKLAAFIYDPDNRDFIERIAGREFGEYREELDAKYLARRAGQNIREVRGWGNPRGYMMEHGCNGFEASRYAALSFFPSTGQTIEFRMFQGTTDSDVILACMEFSFACWHFAHQYGMKDMNEQGFLSFIYRVDNRPDTKYLRRYLERDLMHHSAVLMANHTKSNPKPIKAKPVVLAAA